MNVAEAKQSVIHKNETDWRLANQRYVVDVDISTLNPTLAQIASNSGVVEDIQYVTLTDSDQPMVRAMIRYRLVKRDTSRDPVVYSGDHDDNGGDQWLRDWEDGNLGYD